MAKPIRHNGKWRNRWTDEHGERQSEVHDDYKTAAFLLRQHEVHVEEVARGIRQAVPADKTVHELCDYWLANRATQKRSQEDDISIIRKHLRPAFGALRVRELGVAHVDRFRLERAHLSPKTVNNLLTLLIAMLNCACDLNWLEKVPRIKKPRVRMFDRDYRFLRTDDEIRRFLEGAKAEGEDVYALYATAIMTGARAGELAGLTWSNVHFNNGVNAMITIQQSFDGPTKAGEVHHVPIFNELLPVLRAWRLRSAGSPFVFPNAAGKMFHESASVFQEVLHRVLKNAGFEETHRRGKLRSYITFHDLRHTFASHWMMRAGDLFKLQKILGHQSIQMTQRYAHLLPNAFAGDLGRFDGVLPGDGGIVVELARRNA